MTIDEAIKHAEEVAEEKQKQADGNIQFVKDNIQYLYDGNKYRKCCECAEEHRQLAEWLKELKQLRKQTRWIPVSERLPEIDEYVLVTDGITMYIGWIDSTDNKWRVDSEDSYFINEVDAIAWMPLPKPYKKEDEDE